jgi:peptidoglycan/xylan/chitin deacetylase (PgdA/CDA1 family)
MPVTIRSLLRAMFTVPLLALSSPSAGAAECLGNPDALGTSRVLRIDPATTPPVGRKHFPQTLPLAPRELVLTFDDGPWPGTTGRVLTALRRECVRATFFMLGRNAAAHPALARRVLSEGHTVGHHTYGHPLLNRMSLARAEAEINHGFVAVDTALYGAATGKPRTPFFRFPGFAGSADLLAMLARRRILVFGADLWASDWNPMTPDQERELLLQRLEAAKGGIVLLHDTKAQTAAMLPGLLRELKRRDYRVVHIVTTGTVAHATPP